MISAQRLYLLLVLALIPVYGAARPGIPAEFLPATVPSGYAADAFVAIHADGSPSTAARGFKISTRWNSIVAMQDVRLVELLTDAYRSATGLPEDSAVTRNMRGYYAYSPRRP